MVTDKIRACIIFIVFVIALIIFYTTKETKVNYNDYAMKDYVRNEEGALMIINNTGKTIFIMCSSIKQDCEKMIIRNGVKYVIKDISDRIIIDVD